MSQLATWIFTHINHKMGKLFEYRRSNTGSDLFFSSSSLFAFFLNLGSSCCSSSLAASLSFCAVLSLAKWNVVLSPVWRTSWSWILALPSGLIFWPEHIKNIYYIVKCYHWHDWFNDTHSVYPQRGGWLWNGLCPLDPRLSALPSGKACHPASSAEPFSPPAAPPLTARPWQTWESTVPVINRSSPAFKNMLELKLYVFNA